jgi:hypothetical protein
MSSFLSTNRKYFSNRWESTQVEVVALGELTLAGGTSDTNPATFQLSVFSVPAPPKRYAAASQVFPHDMSAAPCLISGKIWQVTEWPAVTREKWVLKLLKDPDPR